MEILKIKIMNSKISETAMSIPRHFMYSCQSLFVTLQFLRIALLRLWVRKSCYTWLFTFTPFVCDKKKYMRIRVAFFLLVYFQDKGYMVLLPLS